MSDSIIDTATATAPVVKAPARPRREPTGERRPRQPAKRPLTAEVTDFKVWLKALDLGIDPNVHINGCQHLACVVTVDFGTPKGGVKLTNEQISDLVYRMRAMTRTVMGREVKVGVMNDATNGIWWTNING